MIRYYLDPLPASIEEPLYACTNPANLLVEVIDQSDADVVTPVVELADLTVFPQVMPT